MLICCITSVRDARYFHMMVSFMGFCHLRFYSKEIQNSALIINQMNNLKRKNHLWIELLSSLHMQPGMWSLQMR